ncbi:hypothetical protein Patl1_26319 [Pistacia atlantica]|uniref:Uncharacterized protein n=1 Tax=Pistacia atlantica TaxID=434234 RepID=A0ACC1B3B9_9ROSI|nr:hypothetical protein Patl1_26319 [Pistacia atlantica]
MGRQELFSKNNWEQAGTEVNEVDSQRDKMTRLESSVFDSFKPGFELGLARLIAIVNRTIFYGK